MKKLVITAAVLVGLGFLAKRFGPQLGNIDWEQRFESMPDNAPPKWMFRNISTIRQNTDRMLEILEERGPSAGTAEAVAEKPLT